MTDQPDYFDSQAQAAVALDLDIEQLREAKRQGCTAFRSGRVYRAPLVAWLETQRRPTAKGTATKRREVPVIDCSWKARRSVLFELRSFLEYCYLDGELDGLQYAAALKKSAPLIVQLGRAWNAEIAEAGFLADSLDIARKAIAKHRREHPRK